MSRKRLPEKLKTAKNNILTDCALDVVDAEVVGPVVRVRHVEGEEGGAVRGKLVSMNAHKLVSSSQLTGHANIPLY